ncbi:MAG: HAD hydrolase-like protein [Terracidiphilus sp.]|jgi:phosphoglycolate phosphatase-like HAD superfamily hydrolase
MLTTPPTSEVRIAIEPGFDWDGQDAYLFDIDGTLLRDPDRIHMNSFASSIERVTGFAVTLDGVPVHGSTDTAILSEACRRAGIPAEVLELQVEAILEAMRQTVHERRHELKLRLMPGVENTLAHLAGKGALLGVATGNLEMIGWIKIEEAGLREWFRFGGFSDHFPDRAKLVGNAASKARELAGTDARICVVGDTPRDIDAAHANHLPVIAVATGSYSFDALFEGKPEVCASSLADLLAMGRTARG